MRRIEVDERTEQVARAICRCHGFDPDKDVVLQKNIRDSVWGPRWRKYIGKAKEQIAAYDTLRSLESI